MKLLIDDEKLKRWAVAVSHELSVLSELNNPGGLLWLGQLGATPSVPLVVGQPRPLAKFDTWEHGMGALYRELTSMLNGEKEVTGGYMVALKRVMQGLPPHSFPQYFTREA